MSRGPRSAAGPRLGRAGLSLRRPGPLARASLQTLAVHGARLLVQVALLLLLALWLGPERYGEYAAAAALAFGLGMLSSFGLGFLVLTESARSPEAGADLLARAIPATLLSAALLLPVYLWSAVALLGSRAGLPALVLIGAAELLLAPLLGVLAQRVHGLGRVARSQLLALLPMLARLAGMAGCYLLAAPSLELGALVHGLGAAVALLLGLALAAPTWPLRRPTLPLLRSGSRYALMHLTASIPTEVDKALALRLLESAETGVYALASRGLAVVTLPVIAMLQAALPRLVGGLEAREAAAPALVRTVLLLAVLYGALAALALHALAAPLLEWAMGGRYPHVGSLLQGLALVAPFMSTRVATGMVLFAAGRPLLRSAVEGAAVLGLLALAPVLAARHGVEGLLWAVVACEAAMALAGLALVAPLCRRPGLPPVGS